MSNANCQSPWHQGFPTPLGCPWCKHGYNEGIIKTLELIKTQRFTGANFLDASGKICKNRARVTHAELHFAGDHITIPYGDFTMHLKKVKFSLVDPADAN